jgi:uncharacterized membrane-anchored protein
MIKLLILIQYMFRILHWWSFFYRFVFDRESLHKVWHFRQLVYRTIFIWITVNVFSAFLVMVPFLSYLFGIIDIKKSRSAGSWW